MNKIISILVMLFFSVMLYADSTVNMHQLLPTIHAVGDGASGYENVSNPLGAYTFNLNGNEFDPETGYDPNEGRYEIWTMTYGDQHIRKFSLGVNGSGWNNYYNGTDWVTYHNGYGDHADRDVSNPGLDNIVGTSVIYVRSDAIARVSSGSPDFSSGVCNSALGPLLSTGSFVLNPAPLFFNGISYQKGELALITAIAGATDPYYRKVVLLYDLRQIKSYTDRQPDYNTGQDGEGNQTSQYGAYNQADWNDCFYPLVTGLDILNSIPEAGTTGKTFNFGRQAVWASDASAVYFAGYVVNANYSSSDPDDSKYWNGIWKYDFASGELVWIKREYSRDNTMYFSEMAVLDTSVRDFTGGNENGIQILYSSETVNPGGISCIVDNDQVNPAVYTVVDINEFSSFQGSAPEACDIRNIVTTSEGDIYFYCLGNSLGSSEGTIYRGPYALYRYDKQGRYYAVSNRAMHMNFHFANNVSVSSTTGAMGNFQYYDNLFGKKMLTFRSTPLKAPCGVEIFEPLDFNFDGQVDMADLVIFRDQRILNDYYMHPFYTDKSDNENIMPAILEAPAEYIACDINGNSNYRSTLIYGDSGEMVPEEVLATLDYSNLDPNMNYTVDTDNLYFNEKIVTVEDAEVLYEFIPAGDADLNGTVNLFDFALLAENYITGDSDNNRKDFGQGDFDFDGDVDFNDLILMLSSWKYTLSD